MVLKMRTIEFTAVFEYKTTPDDLDWDDPDSWDSEDYEFLVPPDLADWWPEAVDPEDN